MTTQVGAAPLVSWENEGGLPATTAQTDERLDWAGFLARFYPDARKHEYVPLAAYVEYRNGLPPVAAESIDRPPERR